MAFWDWKETALTMNTATKFILYSLALVMIFLVLTGANSKLNGGNGAGGGAAQSLIAVSFQNLNRLIKQLQGRNQIDNNGNVAYNN